MPILITAVTLLALVGLGMRVLQLERAARLRSDLRVAALSALIDPRGDGASAVFNERSSVLADSHLPLRLGLGAAVAIVLVASGLMLRTMYGAPDAPAAPTPSLALLSMTHAREGQTLTVTGRLKNQSSAPANRVTAVISVFDKKDRAVASASAPIDLQSLAAGADSSFRVSIPRVAEVGRYRVSFQNDSGLVRHVDRRSGVAEESATIAQR